MKESYKEDLASNFGLELYADDGNGLGVATAEVYAGKLMSSEINHSVRRHYYVCGVDGGKATSHEEHRL